jgi:large subunit ribosomal protein L21
MVPGKRPFMARVIEISTLPATHAQLTAGPGNDKIVEFGDALPGLKGSAGLKRVNVRPAFRCRDLYPPHGKNESEAECTAGERSAGGFVMYAVIRTGGKQYRVAPGDVVKIEKVAAENQTVEFADVLAVSGEGGSLARPSTAKVTAEVLGDGRGDKILVFHLKRKKQYKKLQGHRQSFTEVRITAIEADGVTYTAAN